MKVLRSFSRYCHVNNVSLVAPITGYVNVTSNNENAFKVALFKQGPLSVAIDASRRAFTFYSHGVFYDPECKNTLEGLDHAVLAVGYGKISEFGVCSIFLDCFCDFFRNNEGRTLLVGEKQVN